MDPKIAGLLSDQDLAMAAHGSGSIPSWLAVAELQKRNNLRQSAPVAQSQSTIAQDVVGKALRSSGIMGQLPVAPPAAPAGGIITGSQPQPRPQTYSKGGAVVRLADGGMTDGVMDTLRSAGVIPNVDPDSINYAPVEYKPAVAPDATTLDQAASKIRQLFGRGPDYDKTLADTQAIQPVTPNAGVGNFLLNLVGGAGRSRGNAGEAFATGLGAANAAEETGKQQGFQNSLARQKQILGIQGMQDERQRAIAQSAMQYRNVNAQIADAQAREAAETARGNSEGALQAQRERAQLEEQKSAAVGSFLKNMGNPLFAASYGHLAAQRGDTVGAQLAQDAVGAWKNQQQTASDIQQKRQMAVEGQRAADQMKAVMAEKALEHQYRMEEMGLGLNPDGTMNIPVNDKGVPQVSHLARDIAEYHQRPPSPMSLTRPQARRLQDEVDAWSEYIHPGVPYNASYYNAIEQARKDALPGGKTGSNVYAANNAMAHLDLLGQYAKNLNNTNLQLVNSLKNKVSEALGRPAPTNFDGIKNQVAGELVSSLKRNGIPDKDAQEKVSEGMKKINSPDQLNGYIDSQIQIIGGKIENGLSATRRIPGIPKDDPMLDQLGYSPAAKQALYSRGFDPSSPLAGKILAGLPGGFGKPIDKDTALKFLKAAGGDTKKAKRIAYDFGWR